MVKAGPTDAVIESLMEVFEPGDIIIDGGNSLFTDTIRREKAVRERGFNFVGMGVSGGEEGALLGPSIMPGGPDEAWVTLGPILKLIAAVAEGEPCVTHVGHDGAGHFVKMVHNGIEYADMQLIAEAYDLIRRGTGKTAEIADIFAEWNRGELESYLIEITAEVLRQVDATTGKPLVDVILDSAGAKGTGAWTVQTALDLGVPVSGIAEATFARSLSSHPESAPSPAARTRRTRSPSTTPTRSSSRCASLYASKIVAYSQGFDEIRAAASTAGRSTSARSRRSGARLHHPRPVPQPHRRRLRRRAGPRRAADRAVLRRRPRPRAGRVAADRRHGRDRRHPAPAFSSSLAYYDGLRAKRLPAALIQASATSSARTPTSASTRRHLPHLWSATAPRSKPKTPTDAGARAGLQPVVALEEGRPALTAIIRPIANG
jgi:6-phosphogluconate dehydrogenase